MRRQRQQQRRYYGFENSADDTEFHMQKMTRPAKFENTIEAQVQDGETLQALAVRFHCTVAEIKRLNKIDKDNEIYARKTIKVPLTPHSVLLEALTTTTADVHKSGRSSPKSKDNETNTTVNNYSKQQLPKLNNTNLNEKLLVASVNASEVKIENKYERKNDINQIILNSTLKSNGNHLGIENEVREDDSYESCDAPLLSGIVDESVPHPRSIPLPSSSKGIFDCSGSDCDMSWICLFIFILALCFAIPLIYVFYIAEHPEKFHHNSSN